MAVTNFQLKFSMIFSSAPGYGWQEIHYSQVPSSTYPNLVTALNDFVTQVVTPRIGILGSDCLLEGCRVSYKNPGNGVASKATEVNQFGATTGASLDQNTSLSIVMQDLANLRHKIIHLRGFPYQIVYGELYQPSRYPGWATIFNQYINGLVNNGYGWLNSASSSVGNVSLYAIQTNGTIIFTVVPDATSVPLPTTTNFVPVRFSKLNNSRSVLNKTIVCQVTSPTTIQTVNPIAAGVFTGQGRYHCNFAPTFTAYGGVGPVKVGERRMGRPIGRYPGRRSRRPAT